MQILFRVFLIFVCMPSLAWGQRLTSADSLFEAQKFQRALLAYEAVYAQGTYSPQMLLRMALITEGLGRYPETLYYLNQYYLRQPDPMVLAKMRSLAQQRQLAGYEAAGFDQLLGIWRRFGPYLLGLLVLGAAAMLWAMWRNRRRGEVTLYHPLFFLLFLSGAAFLVNYGDRWQMGIVRDAPAYLMQAPAAGAPTLRQLAAGSRLQVRDQTDVWVEVRWEGQAAYVHRERLRLLD